MQKKIISLSSSSRYCCMSSIDHIHKGSFWQFLPDEHDKFLMGCIRRQWGEVSSGQMISRKSTNLFTGLNMFLMTYLSVYQIVAVLSEALLYFRIAHFLYFLFEFFYLLFLLFSQQLLGQECSESLKDRKWTILWVLCHCFWLSDPRCREFAERDAALEDVAWQNAVCGMSKLRSKEAHFRAFCMFLQLFLQGLQKGC